MRVELTAEQQAILERLVASGRYASTALALEAGIEQLVEAEADVSHIRGLVQEALDSAERGEVIRGDDFLRERYEHRLKRA